MKYHIYNSTPPPPPEPEVNLQLRVVLKGDYADVVATDEAGNQLSSGYLVRFTREGCVQLHSDVNPRLGFKLDDLGKIVQTYYK